MKMDYWFASIWIYLTLAFATLIPTLKVLFSGVQPNPSGISFKETMIFSEETKRRLSDHYSRLEGTLGFWKNRATSYTKFHYYCVIWTILSSWAVPLVGAVAPQAEGSASKWLLVVISSHVAIALSFHRGMKVSEGMKAFRHGESEFYDLYRRLLDRPHVFGETEEAQVDKYFLEVERIRKFVRNAETESIPDVDSSASGVKAKDASAPTDATK